MDPKQLTEYLERTFPGSRVSELGVPPGGTRLGGVLSWEGFDGETQLERQNLLWAKLRERFAVSELAKLSLILTFTPEEIEAMTAEP